MSGTGAATPTLDTTAVLARLGGWQGLVDGAAPPLLFVVTNTGAGLLGYGEQSLAIAAATAGGAAVTLGVVRLAAGRSLSGVVRGLAGLVLALGVALWTGQARDFFLPGIVVDGFYATALTVSVLLGRPVIGYAYAALFRVRAWRDNRRLRRALALATLGWALIYLLRFSVQLLLYGNDEAELLAVAKLGLGWPVTAVAVVLTLRAARRALRDR